MSRDLGVEGGEHLLYVFDLLLLHVQPSKDSPSNPACLARHGLKELLKERQQLTELPVNSQYMLDIDTSSRVTYSALVVVMGSR